MARFTIDSATDFLFGTCVNALSAGLPYAYNVRDITLESRSARGTRAVEFSRAFLEAQEKISNRERLGKVWPLFEILHDSTAESMKVVNAYLEPIIQEALSKHKFKPVGGGKTEKIAEDATLLDHLVDQTQGTGPTIYASRLILLSVQIQLFSKTRRTPLS